MSITIPEGAEWMPAAYMDEIVPPGRASPSGWIVPRATGGWALASGWDDGDDRDLIEGEVVEFHAQIAIADPTLTIAFDGDGGRIWHCDPPGPFTAPPGFELSIWDGAGIWASVEDAAYELSDREHELHVYAWTTTAMPYRFTEGRFEPVREDA